MKKDVKVFSTTTFIEYSLIAYYVFKYFFLFFASKITKSTLWTKKRVVCLLRKIATSNYAFFIVIIYTFVY